MEHLRKGVFPTLHSLTKGTIGRTGIADLLQYPDIQPLHIICPNIKPALRFSYSVRVKCAILFGAVVTNIDGFITESHCVTHDTLLMC